TAIASLSTNVACAAPRDSASSPSAPLPANRSRQRDPGTRGPNQLNSVSRTLSGGGRISGCGGEANPPPRHDPPIIRNTRKRAARPAAGGDPLPDLLEFVTVSRPGDGLPPFSTK